MDTAASRIGLRCARPLPLSREEALLISICEAMTASVEVVAMDVDSGHGVIRFDEVSLLVPPGELPFLEATLRRMMTDCSLGLRPKHAWRATWEAGVTVPVTIPGLVEAWDCAVEVVP